MSDAQDASSSTVDNGEDGDDERRSPSTTSTYVERTRSEDGVRRLSPAVNDDVYVPVPGVITTPPDSPLSSEEEDNAMQEQGTSAAAVTSPSDSPSGGNGEDNESAPNAPEERRFSGPITSPPDSPSSSDGEDDNTGEGERSADPVGDIEKYLEQVRLHRAPSSTGYASRAKSSSSQNETMSKPESSRSNWFSHSDPETDSEGESHAMRPATRPSQVRTKTGRLVRPVLRNRSSSTQETPTFSKAVHFDSHLEDVRHFLQVDRPLAVSSVSSPIDVSEDEFEFPFPALRKKRSYPIEPYDRASPEELSDLDPEHSSNLAWTEPRAYTSETSPVYGSDSDSEFPFFGEKKSHGTQPSFDEWEVVMASRGAKSPPDANQPVKFEDARLAPDQKSLEGLATVVMGMGSERTVACRFTLDDWTSYSEIEAKESGAAVRINEPYGIYTFSISLPSPITLDATTVDLCMRMNIDGRNYWDNNDGANFQVYFRKKPRPQPQPRARKASTKVIDDFLVDTGRRSGPTSNPDSPSSTSQPFANRYEFANRYDFGAYLSGAMAEARDRSLPGDNSGLRIGSHDQKATVTRPEDIPFESSTYQELVQKYCFHGSDKGPPQIQSKDGHQEESKMKILGSSFAEEVKHPSEDDIGAPKTEDTSNVTQQPMSEDEHPDTNQDARMHDTTSVEFEGSAPLGIPDPVNNERKSALLGDAENEYDDTDSDNSSDISSLWSTPTSDGSSATSALPSEVQFSMHEVSDIILEDAGLATILTAAMSHPGLESDNLHKEFKRLMGSYYRDLKKSSTAPDLNRVVRLFKKSSGIIANEARMLLGLIHAKPLFEDPRSKMTQREKNEVLQYLWERAAGPPAVADEQKGEPDPEPALPERPQETGPQYGPIGEEDEDDSEDEGGVEGGVEDVADDAMYPELSAAVAFLKDGVPMQKFQEKLRKFVLDTARDLDVRQYPKSLPRSLPNLVDEIWCRLRLNLTEPRVPHGKRRIRWTCSCGVSLYDDFDEKLDSAALNDLETRLNEKSWAQTNRDNDSGNGEGTNAFMKLISQIVRWATRHFPLLKPRSQSQPSDTDLPTYNTPTTSPADNTLRRAEPIGLLYLLYCTSTGTHGAKFYQNLIHDNLNDHELFKFFRTIYCRARKESSWFTLRTTTNISLCKFFVDYSKYASVRKHDQSCMQDCVCLPPESLIGREYKCHPVPPNLMPPFEKNYLMHYFLNPCHLSSEQAWAFTQLPKRMNETLQPGANSFLPGWGIYFEEGWHWKTIYLLVSTATVIGSLIFGICWSVLKLDVQGAFGITSYWVAVVAMGMGFLALRSTNKL